MKNIVQKLLIALAIFAGINHVAAQGTAFTYQGRLNDGANPATGVYDLRFTVYDAATDGNAYGALTNAATPVTNGLFTVALDFGAGIFNGVDRWLEIGVRTNGASDFTTLALRQSVTPTPYAIFANTASNLLGTVPVSQLSGTIPVSQLAGTVITNHQTSVVISGSFNGNGSGLTNLNASQLTGSVSNISNLYLPATTASAGIIYGGGSTLVQAYGNNNFFAGSGAGNLTLTGSGNTGVGNHALINNTTGVYNTASGVNALYSNAIGAGNTASGYQALLSNTNGHYNTAIGISALQQKATGSHNIALGDSAGLNQITGDWNIDIGNPGSASEAGTIRIGTPGTHSATYLAGTVYANGGGLTNLNASQLTGGTLALAQLPVVVVTNGASGLNLTGSFNGNGAGITNVDLKTVNASGAIAWTAGWGNFSAATVRVGDAPRWVVTADVNKDTFPDLVCAAQDTSVFFLTNNGTGVFTPATTNYVGSWHYSVAVADVNHDDNMDVIVPNYWDDTVTVLTNNGAGAFVPASTNSVGTGANPTTYFAGAYSVTTADVNGDGWADIICSTVWDSKLTVLTNDGSGGFVLSALLDAGAQQVVAADVNGDGHPDLVSLDWFNGRLMVLTNDGSGGFVLASSPSVGFSYPNAIGMADFNSDGKVDFIVAGSTVTVLTNSDNGNFALAFTADAGAYMTVPSDIYGDGRLALIGADRDDGLLTIQTNRNGGGYGPTYPLAVPGGPVMILATDLNGDGKTDLVSVNIDAGTLTILQNQYAVTPGFAGDGAGLIHLNATALTGTVADKRLSANVALLNANQTFTGNNAFDRSVWLNDHPLYLRGGYDQGHGLGWFGNGGSSFAGENPDGPVLFGYYGGMLGTTLSTQNWALRWDAAGNVTMHGQLIGDGSGLTNVAGVMSRDGSSLTNLNAASLIGTLPPTLLPSGLLTNGAAAVSLAGQFYGQAFGGFYGDGSALYFLNASQLASGTVPDARLSANVPRLNAAAQTFAGSNIFNGVVIATNANNQISGTFTGDGSGLSNITATVSGNGSGLTNLNAASLTGTVGMAANFTGALNGDVTGTQNATTVASVGGQTAANIATGAATANAATSFNTANAIVRRNGSGSFTSTSITLNGNLNLPVTTSSVGIIYAGGIPLIHAYGNNDFFAGSGAGNLTLTGSGNTGVGFQALLSNTSGYNNTAVGVGALSVNQDGNGNTANGAAALSSNTNGSANTASGVNALAFNTSGNYNTANGASALQQNTTGENNTASGANALLANTSGNHNTANGVSALQQNTTGSDNTASGYQALYSNQTGFDNTANGYQTLYHNMTGFENTANGYSALYYNTTGCYNTANGYSALLWNVDGNNNTANGYLALLLNSSGSNNTASGSSALRQNRTGGNNTANGANALYRNLTGNNNSANGASALQQNTDGSDNTASGYQSLTANTIGNYNTANGYLALAANLSGSQNTANGGEALEVNTNGSYNLADGFEALNSNTSGNDNTAVGYLALRFNQTGSGNIALGSGAGVLIVGRDNIDIGNPGVATDNDIIRIGYYQTATYLTGTVFANGVALASDRNMKENFKPVDNRAVLAKVAALPVTEWNYKTDQAGVQHIGPMAQDFQAAFGLAGPDDKHISVVDENGVALAAIQGLNQKLEEKDAKISALEKRLAELEHVVQALAGKR